MNEKQQTTETKGKELIGKVVSTKMKKTVVVLVAHSFAHPLYKKMMRRTKRYACHNESLDLKVGDTVHIAETKPMSRRKHFMVVEKV